MGFNSAFSSVGWCAEKVRVVIRFGERWHWLRGDLCASNLSPLCHSTGIYGQNCTDFNCGMILTNIYVFVYPCHPEDGHVSSRRNMSPVTPRSRVLLEKLTGFQLIKKFPVFYGTRRFITAFTTARQLPLSWASSIQSTNQHPTSWRSILILSSHLRLGSPSGLCP